jgi:DNA-binding transcriptional regulator YhcF (GntR family)
MLPWRKAQPPEEPRRLRRRRLNFTDDVRLATAWAREEAIKLQHDYVGTEHILLGLTRLPEGLSNQVFERAKITADYVQKMVAESVRHGRATIALGELPYTSRAKKVFEFAMEAAVELDVEYVGAEHLLLGLLLEEKGIAAQVLNSLGLTYPRAALLVRSFYAEAQLVEAPAAFRFKIDDASDRSIYEQIIEQVQEAVATGSLKPRDRLPAVRQLADELDIAPGTVARAYAELERLGVVVTEGARGTRIAERKTAARAPAESEETIVGLLRPVAVAAFHMGANAHELRSALEQAMKGIFEPPPHQTPDWRAEPSGGN